MWANFYKTSAESLEQMLDIPRQNETAKGTSP